MKVVIVGAGRVGSSFGYLLAEKGFEILGVFNKHFNSARNAVKKIGQGQPLTYSGLLEICNKADLIIITTPDDKIENIAEKILENDYSHLYLMHMSGLHSSDILKKAQNINVFSLHPLQAIANFKEGIKLLPDSTYTLEGDEKGIKLGKKIIEKLDLNYNIIQKEYKPLYHAAAVIASNYLVTLTAASYELLEEADILNNETKKGLLGLVKGTLNNLENLDPEEALTGPIARGDIKTIQKHIDAIKKHKNKYLELYKVLGEYTAEMKDKNLFDKIN